MGLSPLHLVFCSAEVAPFAKVGGLGDVVGSLPKALSERGINVSIVMPRYGNIDPKKGGFSPLETTFNVDFNDHQETVGLWKGSLPGCDTVTVYLLDHEFWFTKHPAVYPPNEPDYERGRFQFFSHAVLKGLEALALRPHVLHVHDWHTALIPALLSNGRSSHFSHTKTVLTIHNLAYQGWHGDKNQLAEGIQHADWITTVSPTYAREIQTPEYGCGLDGLLQNVSHRLQGIINGIDTEAFNPQTDPALKQTYDVHSVASGKAICKADLQQQLNLPQTEDPPLFGFVSRLVDQKGLDIFLPVLTQLLENPSEHLKEAQWVILGTGDPTYEEALRNLSHRFPQLSVTLGFDVILAQKIYAGSDFFLMPSKFEPCGLGQLIAMRYGSLPVVRSTGGLADTVIDAQKDPENGTGLSFNDYEESALYDALQKACQIKKGDFPPSDLWPKLRHNAMMADFSWKTSAKAYHTIYNALTSPVKI